MNGQVPLARGPGRWLLLGGLTVLGLFALGLVSWWVVETRQFRKMHELATADLAAGRYAAARDRLAWLVAKQPRGPDFQFQLGVCEQALGHFDAAVRAWAAVPADSKRALEAEVRHARTLIHSLGRLSEAEAVLEGALARPGPLVADAFWMRVELLIWEARLSEVRRLLEWGWRRVPVAHRVAVLREHWRLDRVEVTENEMRPVLAAAEKFAPEDPRVNLLRGAMAMRYGRYAEAARELDTCIAAHPDDLPAWSVRLSLARASAQPEMAASALRHLPADFLEPSEVLTWRVWFATQRGDMEAELRFLERLADLDLGNPTALDRLTDLAQRVNDNARATSLRDRQAEVNRLKESYRWGVIKAPDHPDRGYAENLARWAEALGRDFEAEGWWSLALVASPGNPTYLKAITDLNNRRKTRIVPPEASFGALLADIASIKPASTALTGPVVPVRFTDDAAAAGLNAIYESPPSPKCQVPEVMGGGVALLDYDGDGWLDVFVLQAGPFPPPDAYGRSRDRLFRNRGDGTFEDVSEKAGITDLPGGYGFAVTVGDYDNDGRPDLFLSRWRSYALWHNTGGRFEDVTDRVGLGGDRGWPMAAAFADFDGDGDLDLYVCQYMKWDAVNPPICKSAQNPGRIVSCLPLSLPSEPDRLYRNDGGRFVDVSETAGITAADRDGRGLGVLAADLDGDDRIDLYVTNDQSANFLFHNIGGMKFEDAADRSGTAYASDGVSRAGMGIAYGDVDGDMLPDLAIMNFFGESITMYKNVGDGLFIDQSGPSGLALPSHFRLSFGAAFLDVDHDGNLDLATANGHVNDERPSTPYTMPPSLYLGDGSGHFSDVSDQAGTLWKRPHLARGLAAGDLDNDGRVDLIMVPQNEPLVFAHNRTVGGHSITFRLEGASSNRDAIGARVTISAGGRRSVRWRIGGGSYGSASSPCLHFGLASATRVDTVEVAWPSGRVDRYAEFPADTGYLVREGAEHPEPLIGFRK